MNTLIEKKFIICFDSGIVAMKHHRINNYIQKDRYTETSYLEEKSHIYIKENKAYTLNSSHSGIVPLIDNKQCIQNVSKMETQSSLVKSRLGKVSVSSKGDDTHLFLGELENVKLTPNQYGQLCAKYENVSALIDRVSLWIPDNPRNNHYAVCLTFARNDNWPKIKKMRKTEVKESDEDPMSAEEMANALSEMKKKLGGTFNAD